MRLAEESRHQRHQQQHDQPRREDDQAGRKTGHGDEVLRLGEELAHERHAAAGLAARAFELVLEFGVLEILEVEGCGMLHQSHARTRADPLGQQAVEEGDDAAQYVGQYRHRELGGQQQAQLVEMAAVEPLLQRRRLVGQLHQHHHVVDDQLADIERGHRQQGAYQAQEDGG